MTVEELQIAAKQLNLCLVTTAKEDEKVIPALKEENVPTVPKRRQASDQTKELAGNVNFTPHLPPDLECTKQPMNNSTEYSSEPSQSSFLTGKIAGIRRTAEELPSRKDENTVNIESVESVQNVQNVDQMCLNVNEGQEISHVQREKINFDFIENIECNQNLNNEEIKVMNDSINNIENSQETITSKVCNDDSKVLSDLAKEIQASFIENIREILEKETDEENEFHAPALLKCQSDAIEIYSQSLEELTDNKHIENRKDGEADKDKINNEENTMEKIDQEIILINTEKVNNDAKQTFLYSDKKSSEQNVASINIKEQVEEIKPQSTKKTKAPQPPSLSNSLSSFNLVEPSEKIVHLTPNTSRKQDIGSDENILLGCGQLELSEDDKDEGKVLYQSPVYPTLYTTLKDDLADAQPINERILPFPITKILTHSPSTGITRLRKYDCMEDDPAHILATPPTNPTVPPLSPRAEYLGTTSSRKCPHCTIHNWLPHSPGCSNKK